MGPYNKWIDSSTVPALNALAFFARGRLATRVTGMSKGCQMDCCKHTEETNTRDITANQVVQKAANLLGAGTYARASKLLTSIRC